MTREAALRVGYLAQHLGEGYYAYLTALGAGGDPRPPRPARPPPNGSVIPVGYVQRNDGTSHLFRYDHYERLAQADSGIVLRLARVWLVGALVEVGNALGKDKYFDRSPILELVRYLRNGVGHNNQFRIDNPAGLAKFPAHNRLAAVQSPAGLTFEITPDLQGHGILFDFMGPGDVLDVLFSVSYYLGTLPVDWPVSTRVAAWTGYTR